jgi:hypothetical protein
MTTSMATTTKLMDLVPDPPSGPVDVTIDEGGMRCVWKSHARAAYIPLIAIEDVSVDETFFGGVRLVLDGHDDEDALELEISKTASPVAIQRVLLVGLEEQRRATPIALPETTAMRIERRARALDEWLLDVLRATDAGYRETPVDLRVLESVLADPHATVECRAASAWALLAASDLDDDHLRSAITSIVGHALPPLVLAVAGVAAGSVLIPDDVAAEVEVFLSPADRSALAKLRASVPEASGERSARLLAALERAKEAAMARLKKEMDDLAEENRESKWRRLHSASSGSDTRWVGKTWAL